MRNLCRLATFDALTWVVGDGRRLLRYEVGGLRLAVYKRDDNSTQMANLQSHPPTFLFPPCPTHCHLPKSRSRFLYFYEWSQSPYPVYLLSSLFHTICQVIVFAWNLSGRGILSRTKRSLCGILSIFVVIQVLSRSPPPRLPPILATRLRRTQIFIFINLSDTPFLLGHRWRLA